MSVNRRKRLVGSSKEAAFFANRNGFESQCAQVVLALDSSAPINAGYVERAILSPHKIREATHYAPPLRLIRKKYTSPQSEPVFVIFIADGGNADRSATTEVIRELSSEPIFIQFVGIGKEDFPFLRKLDELPSRLIDNAGFVQINDLEAIKDAELYDRLLNEFPRWLQKAREKRVLAG